jgi:hypothetical protein
MPAPICIIANVMMKEGMPMRVTPKAVRSPSAKQAKSAKSAKMIVNGGLRVAAIRFRAAHEGQHDRRGVGDCADREIDLGGKDDEGQADGDDAGDRYLLQDVLQVIERRERGAGDAEEQDEEQKRDEGRDITQLIAGEIGEPERALGGDGNIGLGRVHICSSRQAAASRRSLLIASSANSCATSPLRITSTRSASESTVSGSVENTTMAIP